MYSKFLEINEEKQQTIINAALLEFVQNGYDKASTNSIVAKAGISKGILFHYFKNKKQLYLFLFDYSIEHTVDNFFQLINVKQTDFFVLMKEVTLIKFEMMKKYPAMFQFIQSAYLEESKEVKEEIQERSKTSIDQSWVRVIEQVDYSLFKEHLDLGKTLSIIRWTFESLANELLVQSPNHRIDESQFEGIMKQVEEYIEYFKQLFYK